MASYKSVLKNTIKKQKKGYKKDYSGNTSTIKSIYDNQYKNINKKIDEENTKNKAIYASQSKEIAASKKMADVQVDKDLKATGDNDNLSARLAVRARAQGAETERSKDSAESGKRISSAKNLAKSAYKTNKGNALRDAKNNYLSNKADVSSSYYDYLANKKLQDEQEATARAAARRSYYSSGSSGGDKPLSDGVEPIEDKYMQAFKDSIKGTKVKNKSSSKNKNKNKQKPKYTYSYYGVKPSDNKPYYGYYHS